MGGMDESTNLSTISLEDITDKVIKGDGCLGRLDQLDDVGLRWVLHSSRVWSSE